MHSSYISNPNSARGEWLDKLNYKEDIWDSSSNEIYSKMDTALSIARERKAEALRLQVYWEGEVASEEAVVRKELWYKKEEQRKSKEND